MSDTKQTSRGKLNRLQCTTAGSTLRVLDGYGLRDQLPARPTLAPRIRFLFIGSHLCSTLPADPASRRQPLRFTSPSPPSGWVEDFHLRAIEHARHTTNPLAREGSAAPGRYILSRWPALAGDGRGTGPEHRRSNNLQLGRRVPMTFNTSPRPVSPLRARMIEDMTVRGFKEDTRRDYVRHVRAFAAFIDRSPDTATAEDLRLFQLHQTRIGMQPPSIKQRG